MEEPIYSPFFGVLGASSAMVFSAMGAAYGTAKSGTGIAAMSVMRPELIMKSIIPVVMAGIIAIYGVVVAVLIAGQLKPAPEYTLYKYVKKSRQMTTFVYILLSEIRNALRISRIFCRFWNWPKNLVKLQSLFTFYGMPQQFPGFFAGFENWPFLFDFRGFVHLGAGLAVGLSGLAAGYAIGIVGDAGVRGTAQQPRLFVGMILILIFAEVLGLYGLIVAIYLYAK